MNAKNTLAKLESELKTLSAQLKEESSPRKFWLVPCKPAGYTDAEYWAITYKAYEQHNNAQMAKVDALNAAALAVYKRINHIKEMNVIKRIFIK